VQTHSLQITTLSSHLSISPDPLPPPQSHTFRQLHSIDHIAFLNDLKQTSLLPIHLSSLVTLLICMTVLFPIFWTSMHPYLPSDLLVSLLPSPGLPTLFTQLDVNATMQNQLTGPLVHTSIMRYIKLFAVDTTNLSLPQKSLLLLFG